MFNIYLCSRLYILGPKLRYARERGRNYISFFFLHTQIICVSVYVHTHLRVCLCVVQNFSTMHIHKYSSKKKVRPGKNNINKNAPAIIICEKNILKINENELHYTRAAVCIRKKCFHFFFFRHEIKSTIAENIAENNLIVF